MFANGGEPMLLHPDLAQAQRAREVGSCAPFGCLPEQVEPVWRALADSAEAMGHTLPEHPPLTDEPDLHIRIGSRRLNPISVRDGRYTFVISADEASARLVSRTARPNDACPWVCDDRLLGVKIRGLTFSRGPEMRDMALDDPTLDQGWWPVENDARGDRKSTRLNSSHGYISYAVFC